MLKRLLFAAVPLLVLLGGVEGAARWSGVSKERALDAFFPTPQNCLERSPLLGIELAPDCHGTWGGAIATNALGLRDDPLIDDGTPRLLALGDSSTFGWKVDQSDAYPQVLQRVLDTRLGGRRLRVVNAGVSGYTSHHGLLFLRHRSPALAPAIVIVAFGFNDAYRDGPIEEHLRRQRLLMPLLRLDDFLLMHSAAWYRIRRATAGGEPAGGGEPTALPRATPEQFARNLSAIADLVRERGATLVLLGFLDPGNPSLAPYAKALEETAGKLAVPLVVYDGPRLDVVHPTADGYARLAARLAAVLEKQGWLATFMPPDAAAH